MANLFQNAERTEEAQDIITDAATLISQIQYLDEFSKVDVINEIKKALHAVSPMRKEPVDCVLWVPADSVHGNQWNPNAVAPPEMRLLELSIDADGFTQPIVTMLEPHSREVIDGFHRHLVGTHFTSVRDRLMGYLPVVTINQEREDKGDRMAATIRHNRARGKHRIEGMSDIVVELKRRNWSDEKIGRELGMDPDEVLRLTQITGLAEMFINQEFSASWDIDKVDEADVLSPEILTEPEPEE